MLVTLREEALSSRQVRWRLINYQNLVRCRILRKDLLYCGDEHLLAKIRWDGDADCRKSRLHAVRR